MRLPWPSRLKRMFWRAYLLRLFWDDKLGKAITVLWSVAWLEWIVIGFLWLLAWRYAVHGLHHRHLRHHLPSVF
jgi:hypothetical protein